MKEGGRESEGERAAGGRSGYFFFVFFLGECVHVRVRLWAGKFGREDFPCWMFGAGGAGGMRNWGSWDIWDIFDNVKVTTVKAPFYLLKPTVRILSATRRLTEAVPPKEPSPCSTFNIEVKSWRS